MSLHFDLAEARIEIGVDGYLWFSGRIKERSVRWDYRLRLDDADIVQFMALARHPQIVDYVAERLGVRLFRRVLARAWTTVREFAGRRPPALRAVDPESRDGVLVEGPR